MPLQAIAKRADELRNSGCLIDWKSEPLVLAVVTPLMQRAHRLSHSHDIVFVDSTASCDVGSHSVTFFLAPTVVGALPLGVVITEGTTKCYCLTALP